jgi:hypothetical protein
MFTVEKSKIIDLPELLEIANQFWKESPTHQQRPMDLQAVRTHLQTLTIYPTEACVLVCKDEDGNILGGFAGSIQKEWFRGPVLY